VDLAVAGDDGDGTGHEAGVDVTLQHVSDPAEPLRGEASSGHALRLTLSRRIPGEFVP
jgi:hypothetical protein